MGTKVSLCISSLDWESPSACPPVRRLTELTSCSLGSKDEAGEGSYWGLHLPHAQPVPAWELLGPLLSDSPRPQLCPCIYKKRGTRKSQGGGQNAVLWLNNRRHTTSQKGNEAVKVTGSRGQGWLEAFPTAHWIQAKGGTSLWRILPLGVSLNTLRRIFSSGVNPIQGHEQPVSRGDQRGCSNVWTRSCYPSLCFTPTSNPLINTFGSTFKNVSRILLFFTTSTLSILSKPTLSLTRILTKTS